VSPSVLARTLLHQIALLDRLTGAGEPPFPFVIPEEQRRKLSEMGFEWCGLRNVDLPKGREP
ncbi:MAG TPA: hypothetical protein VMN76_06835, partial [Acidobacteriota bacterium]|nr:hypothetical protein [Acidobacteriota bacterium]